ncbi:hypothetical protein DID96_21215 [Burkholderia sp. Bp8963]|nr:hypothetical protein DID96_21215 [Burkholderia sp. Bp8963]
MRAATHSPSPAAARCARLARPLAPRRGAVANPPSTFKDCYTFGQFRLPAGNLCLSASNVRTSRT